MHRPPPPVWLFLDDGWPESRDCDDNYVPVDPRQLPALLARARADAARMLAPRPQVAEVAGVWPERAVGREQGGGARAARR